MQIDFDLSRPIYQQIIDEVKRAIARGEIVPGDKLPSHRELAERSKVNPNTVQHAYREMELEGLVETLRGQGTFVKSDPGLVARVRDEMASLAVSRFLLEMESLGYSGQEIAACVLRAVAGPGSSQEPGSFPNPGQGAATRAETGEVIRK